MSLNDDLFRFYSWENFKAAQESERNRHALLHRAPAKNPDHLTRLVKVRSMGRAFCLHGQRVEVGSIVRVEASSAAELIGLGRAELVED